MTLSSDRHDDHRGEGPVVSDLTAATKEELPSEDVHRVTVPRRRAAARVAGAVDARVQGTQDSYVSSRVPAHVIANRSYSVPDPELQ